jgi:uncharacterized protein (TIGR02001 family)
MKIPRKAGLFLTLVLSCLANVHATELYYNISMVSLYKSSGVDQDYSNSTGSFDEAVRPALQGGVYADLGNGFYVGNWNSTGAFGGASLEIDFYGGYTGTVSEQLSYNVGYGHYLYPGESTWNGGELYLSVTSGAVTAKITNGLSGSLKDGSTAKSRVSLSYDVELQEQLRMTATYGIRNKAAGAFNDYGLTLVRALGEGKSLSATYSAATNASTDSTRKGRLVVGFKQDF